MENLFFQNSFQMNFNHFANIFNKFISRKLYHLIAQQTSKAISMQYSSI